MPGHASATDGGIGMVPFHVRSLKVATARGTCDCTDSSTKLSSPILAGRYLVTSSSWIVAA